MAVVAALKVAEQATEDDVVVVLLPDCGRGYLSKMFNDDWMADYGFLTSAGAETAGRATCCEHKRGQLPQLVHAHPEETVRAAIETLREYGVSPAAGGQGASRR